VHLVEGQVYAVVHGMSSSVIRDSGVPYTGSPPGAQAGATPQG